MYTVLQLPRRQRYDPGPVESRNVRSPFVVPRRKNNEAEADNLYDQTQINLPASLEVFNEHPRARRNRVSSQILGVTMVLFGLGISSKDA